MTDDKDEPILGKRNPQDNLVPFNRLDAETKHRIQSKGGKVSARNRRNRAFMLGRLLDIVNTPLKPNEDQTDINDLLDGKLGNINILDIQTVNEKANLTVYDNLILELIRQSTVGHNYKALTYTLELIRSYEDTIGDLERFLITHPEFMDLYAQHPEIPECREMIDFYEDTFRIFHPELFDDPGDGKR